MNIPRNEACPTCHRYDNRGISVDGVVILEGKILLIKRGVEPFKGFWALPGGFVEWDETLEQAVGREVNEETGLQVIKTTQLPVLSDPKRHPRQVINIPFIVEATGEPAPNDDAEAVAWTPLSELPEELAFDHADIIAMAVAHQQGNSNQ